MSQNRAFPLESVGYFVTALCKQIDAEDEWVPRGRVIAVTTMTMEIIGLWSWFVGELWSCRPSNAASRAFYSLWRAHSEKGLVAPFPHRRWHRSLLSLLPAYSPPLFFLPLYLDSSLSSSVFLPLDLFFCSPFFIVPYVCTHLYVIRA